MNNDSDPLKNIPSCLRPIWGDSGDVVITSADLEEACRISRKGAKAYLDSVVVAFRPAEVTDLIRNVPILAAASDGTEGRFPVVRVFSGAGGASYEPAGVADLVESEESDEGEGHAVLNWRPERECPGCEGLVALVMDRESGEDSARGRLRKAGNGWMIVLNHVNVGAFLGANGRTHFIVLQ